MNRRKLLFYVIFLGAILLIFSAVRFFSIKDPGDKYRMDYSNYLIADYSYRSGKYENAADLYTQILNKEPKNYEIFEKAIISNIYAGKVDRAINIVKKNKHFSNNITDLLLVLENIKNNNANNKINLKNKSQNNLTAFIAIIFPYMGIWQQAIYEDYKKAAIKLEDLLKTEKSLKAFLLFQLAALYQQNNDIEKAGFYYNELIKNNNLTYLQTKIAAGFFKEHNEALKAEQIYNQFNKLHNNIKFFADERTGKQDYYLSNNLIMAEILTFTAKSLIYAGFEENGLIFLQLSLYMSKNFHDAVTMLASYYKENKIYGEVIKLYEDIPPRNDLFWPSRIFIAGNRYHMGFKIQAVKELKKLTKISKNKYLAMTVLADLYIEDEKYEQAMDIYDKILAEDISEGYNKGAILFAKAVCLEKLGKWEEAEKYFTAALQHNKDNPDMLNYFAYSNIERNINIDEAKKMLEKALRQRPMDAEIIDSFGWALYKLKNYDEAAYFIERSLELKPKDPIINDHLGDVYWHLGRLREAKFQWQRALKFAGKESDIKIIKNKINIGIVNGN